MEENKNENAVLLEHNDFVMLVNIYNALLQIHTCGDDSFVYTDAMRALKKIIQNIDTQKSVKGD